MQDQSNQLSRFWRLILIGLSLLSITPFWVGKYFPSQDLPALMSDVFIMHHLHDPQYGFDEYYKLRIGLYGYWGFHLPVYLLHFLFPINIAAKIALSLYAFSMPMSFAFFLRCFGYDERAAILAIPLIYNADLEIGLLCFLFAIPLILWSLGYWQVHFNPPPGKSFDRPLNSILKLALLPISVYIFHVQAGILLIGLIALLCVLNGFGRYRELKYLFPVVGVTIISILSPEASDILRKDYGEIQLIPEIEWMPASFSMFILFFNYAVNEQVFLIQICKGILYGILLLGWIRPKLWRSDISTLNRLTLPLLAIVCLIVYLCTPIMIGSTYFLSSRLVPLVSLFIISTSRIKFGFTGLALVISILSCLVATANIFVMCQTVSEFQVEVAGFDKTIHEASKRGRTLFLTFNPRAGDEDTGQVLLHMDAYLQISNGGDIGQATARYSNHQLTYLPGKRPAAPDEQKPVLFNFEQDMPQFDRVLTRSSPEDYMNQLNKYLTEEGAELDFTPPTIEQIRAEMTKLKKASTKIIKYGQWTLYELR